MSFLLGIDERGRTMIVGKAKNLKVAQLIIDVRVQRHTSMGKVKKTAREWDWMALTPIVVVARRKGYSVVDGHHRVLALKRRFPDYTGLVPCWVLPKMTLAAEARLFLLLNKNNKPVGPADRYHVGLTAQDEAAKTTDEVLRRAGITPRYGKCKLGWNETRCAHSFMKAYLLLGRSGLTEVIKCVMACRLPQGEIAPRALMATFIDGATEYVFRGGKAGSSACPEEVLRRAGRGSLSPGYKRVPAIADVLQEIWCEDIRRGR